MAKKNECGECLFCNCKCPKCGEWEDVHVEWTPRFEISNWEKNEITIESESGRIELRCEVCGYETSNKKELGLLMRNMEHAIDLKDSYTCILPEEE